MTSTFSKRAAGQRLTQFVIEDAMRLRQRANEGAFVVWIGVAVPAELFAGFDNVVYAVPESHAALCAAKGVGAQQAEKAERLGYSTDLCSYARIDLGTAFDGGNGSPIFGLPRPDLLVSDNNNCALLCKWFDVHHREWGVPHVVLDVPFCYERQQPADTAYIAAQLRDLVDTVAQLSGQRFEIDRVREAVKHSCAALQLWKQFLDLARDRPAGISAFDSFVQMAPIVSARGSERLVAHLQRLVEETRQQIARGEFPVADERYRLLWDGIAPWPQLRKMFGRLAAQGANVISASYTYCIGSLEGEIALFAYHGEEPIDYLARLQNATVCPQGMALRIAAMRRAISHYDVDGVIFASNRSCKVYSLMQIDQMRRIREAVPIPCVMIDVDHADARKYAEEAVFSRLEAFLESIDDARA
ncbi:MAG: 2-hydroxyacyl-CoA dehydratase [Deltaproteobacteria bacterium]|nr:2-hydroxyacyl-CoA dehydratase [Deltaproteobacteria bacterium]